MTNGEALREARRWWGRKASVWLSGISAKCYVSNGKGLTVSGDSWEAAFAAADRRQGGAA